MITVFGSINVDFVTRVAHIAQAGETVLGPDYQVFAGGKGGNQALACMRAGAPTRMIGAVGHDPFAQIGLQPLEQAGVDLSHIQRVDAPTGAAFIAVSDAGENAITVASGANRLASAAALSALTLEPSDLVLLQRELPDAQTLAAARWAKAQGARVILNIAPAGWLDPALLDNIDILIANEGEILSLAGQSGMVATNPDEIAMQLDRDRAITTIVTMGEQGVLAWSDGVRRQIDALKVDVLDTTAAGDSFCGAFAAALHRGFGLTGALQRGVAAGSLACTQLGAQSSIPELAAIEHALEGQFA
ncbi:MAG: ribokinase [Rhizobiales bacterium]|jgi:ribokinase|nr:ribokinase [Hyphomicrobiales bacterium]